MLHASSGLIRWEPLLIPAGPNRAPGRPVTLCIAKMSIIEGFLQVRGIALKDEILTVSNGAPRIAIS